MTERTGDNLKEDRDFFVQNAKNFEVLGESFSIGSGIDELNFTFSWTDSLSGDTCER